jgi:uncharacterized protein YPO0396
MKNAQNYSEESKKFNIEVKALPSELPSYLVTLQDLNGNNLSASIHTTFDNALNHMKDLENTYEGNILEKRINANL